MYISLFSQIEKNVSRYYFFLCRDVQKGVWHLSWKGSTPLKLARGGEKKKKKSQPHKFMGEDVAEKNLQASRVSLVSVNNLQKFSEV